MQHGRFSCAVLLICAFLQNLIFTNAGDSTHANTTRLCRNNCRLPSIPFQQPFSIPSTCGTVASFYGCRVQIDVNYTRRAVAVTFSGYNEDSLDMYQVDYDYSVDQGLNLLFYQNLFTSTVILTCLTADYCTDEYASMVVQRLIDNGSILYELLPLYLDRSLNNRTIICVNETEDEIPCDGGYCESITQQTVTWWSYENCGYPGELSVLSAIELTSLTAFFYKYEPQNSATDHVDDIKLTLLCNVDFCNSIETRRRGKAILDRYNLAAFDFTTNSTIATTLQPLPPTTTTTTTTPGTNSSSPPTSSPATSSSSVTLTTQLSSERPPQITNNGLRSWQIALIVIGALLAVVLMMVLIFVVYTKL